MSERPRANRLAGRRPRSDPLAALLRRVLAELIRCAQAQAAAETEASELRGELEETNRGLLALYAELTDQKQQLELARAEAEKASRAKSTFLATMSHEIRSPLNAVIGFTALLLDTQLTAEQGEYAQAVRAAGSHLQSVIDDVLDTAKIEADRLDLEQITFDLVCCVEDAVAIVCPAAEAKALPLAALFAPDTPVTVVGDPVRLRQILVNLLSNAVKFTSAGQISVEVVPGPPTGRMQPVTFHVRDTGIGIAPDALGRLFAPFTQADASTTRRFGGTGLGLYICRQLAERMGGGIAVTSTLGTGSTFVCTIRVGRTEPARREPPLDGARVLVAVDQPLLAEAVAGHLRSWHAHVESAAASAEVDLVVAGGPRLPEAAAAGVPVVAIVAPGTNGSALVGTGGVRAAVTTPVRRSRLYEAVSAALGRAPAEPDAGASERAGPAPVANPRRILVVDDDPANRRAATLLLQRLGHHVDAVEDGDRAVDAVLAVDYDVVLMDLHMPHLDGLEATRRIRERRPGPGPRIVALTADVNEESRRECAQAGMDGVLAKPIAPDRLARAIAAPTGRVLYVDDDDALRLLVERIMSGAPDITVLTAERPAEALELAAAHRPDVILLDLNLAGTTGDAVLRDLRARPATRDIPVVIVSGDTNPATMDRLRRDGAAGYLRKPFTAEALRSTVAGHLR